MRLFKRRKQANQVQQVTSNLVRNAFLSLQRKWVHHMQRLDSKCSLRQKKVIIIIFCTVGSLYCGSILISAFSDQHYPSPATIPTTPIIKASPPDPLSHARLSNDDSTAIRGFRSLIDSMLKSAEGKAVLDSLQTARPGLLDSFYTMERTIQ